MNKVGELKINLAGSTYIESVVQTVKKKGTSLRLQVGYEKGGPLVSFNNYEGNDHFLELKQHECIKTTPIYEAAWQGFQETMPSRTALKQMFPAVKSRNAAIQAYHKASEYSKVIAHCCDIVADATGNQYPRYGVDFNIDMFS